MKKLFCVMALVMICPAMALAWGGRPWASPVLSDPTALKIANNLSDVANAATSRTNLGLGDCATLDMASTAEAVGLSNTQTVLSPGALGETIAAVKVIVLDAVAPNTANTTGDGKVYFVWPYEGTWEIISSSTLAKPGASELTASTSGTLTVQVHNVTDNVDMFSTRITIDENETDSATAATAPVIDSSNDEVAVGDRLRVDIDVAGNGYGCQVRLPFRKK